MTRNALLTEVQRDFLRLSEEERKEEYSKQQRSYHRSEIRERVAASIQDFSLLLDHWDDPEYQSIATDSMAPIVFCIAPLVPPPEVEGVERTSASEGDSVGFVGFVLEKALEQACEKRGHKRRYSVRLTPKESDPRSALELQEDLRQGEITPDGVEQLYQEGRISRDTFATVVVESDEFDDE